MTLNKVDLPQPEGPMTARNSPGRTLSETRSTATSGPSGVSNRFTISSTTRIPASAGVCPPAAVDLGNVVALAIEDLQSHNSRLLLPLPACGERVGVRGPLRKAQTRGEGPSPYPPPPVGEGRVGG